MGSATAVTPHELVQREAGPVEGVEKKSKKARAIEASPIVSEVPAGTFSKRVSSKSRISGKGQLTLPALVRERLGVKAGDEVEFFFDGEQTVVKPVRADENPFEKWIGIAKGVPQDFNGNEWISEMRDDEERREDLKEIGVAHGG